jgi:two-component system sensor histidine kinase UhpB
MEDHQRAIRVFIVASSSAIRRKLLRMFDDIPLVELVGITSERHFSAHTLTEVTPDLLVINLGPRAHLDLPIFSYVRQHLPGCRTLILAKPTAQFVVSPVEFNILIDPEDKASIRCEIQKIADAKLQTACTHEATLSDATMPSLYDYVECIAHGDQGKPFSEAMQAATERRQKHVGRRHSEIDRAERFQCFVEQLPGMPYIATLESGSNNVYVSPKLEQKLGFSRQEWYNNPDLRITQIHHADRERVLKTIGYAVETQTSYTMDYRMYSSNGTLHWFQDEARVIVNSAGKPLFLQGTMLDITDRKQAQEELERSHGELQDLITVIDSLRTEEQRRLAHEMHDDFGQLLAAMKIDLCTLQQHLPQYNPLILKYINNMNGLIDAMVTSVRRIIADLPPKAVEDLGLFGALQAMVGNFRARHQIACRLQIPEREPVLETSMATALFRIVQESLNNVVKHANASAVDIEIHCDSGHVTLCIHDNGKGACADAIRRTGAFGLIGMRERTAALGGMFSFDSNVDKGTTVTVVIPLRFVAPETH